MVLTSAVECAKNTAEAAGGWVWHAKMAAKCGQVFFWVGGEVYVAWVSVHMRVRVKARALAAFQRNVLPVAEVLLRSNHDS